MPDGRETLCNDPMIFADEDRLYLYWGLGSAILGAELDPDQPNRFLTTPKVLIRFHPENWWERFGAANEDREKGFIEGSWMKKIGNTYYLIYSCSGTEYFNYAMGAYVGDSPLGNFAPQKETRFPAVGKGLSGAEATGLLWTGLMGPCGVFTPSLCAWTRLWSAVLAWIPSVLTRRGTYTLNRVPRSQFAPGVKGNPETCNDAGLIPLTVFKPTLASSYAPGHLPLYGVDETMHTWWQPAQGDEEPSFGVLLQGMYQISAVRILWKDIGLDFDAGIHVGPYQYVVEYSEELAADDWKVLVDARENTTDLTVDYCTFPTVPALRVRLRITGHPRGVTPGLLDFTVFGVSASAKPV